MITETSFSGFLMAVLDAWTKGGKKLRIVVAASVGLIVMGISIGVLLRGKEYSLTIGTAMILTGAMTSAVVAAYQEYMRKTHQEQRYLEVEQRFRDNPKETQAAWELAQIKLECYLNRNLSHVRFIFLLTNLVMLGGFILIGIGVYGAFQHSNNFNASILTTGSGVIVSFIGGTFLLLYKATMEQAKNYVAILERINAVGMSLQILSTINEDENKLKDQTTAEIAKQLLSMYAGDLPHNKSTT